MKDKEKKEEVAEEWEGQRNVTKNEGGGDETREGEWWGRKGKKRESGGG